MEVARRAINCIHCLYSVYCSKYLNSSMYIYLYILLGMIGCFCNGLIREAAKCGLTEGCSGMEWSGVDTLL